MVEKQLLVGDVSVLHKVVITKSLGRISKHDI